MNEDFFQAAYAKFRAENPHKVGIAKSAGEWKFVTPGKELRPGFTLSTLNPSLVVLTEDELIAGEDIIPLEEITSAQMRRVGKSEMLLGITTRAGDAFCYRGPWLEEWFVQTVLPYEELPPLKQRLPVELVLVVIVVVAIILALIIGPGNG